MSAEPFKEEGCFAITFERKYYHRGGSFIKRSLRPREFRTGLRGLHIPRVGKERLMNEAESLLFIREHTDIPVPTVYCHFEDDEAYYLIVEYIEGESMSDLEETQKAIVREELKRHLATLKTLKSNRIGGPGGIVIPPYRIQARTEQDNWDLQPSSSDEYVFCHNDLSQQNVVVDPDTLKINAILDWEYAGFFPAHFDFPFYNRLGPSIAIKDEVDDSAELLQFL
ncbi:kinase-like domain-containing protein [Biscogniauxia marginata]|nr:kinase-like domain-containing protein [Biscogniauxia marginata]